MGLPSAAAVSWDELVVDSLGVDGVQSVFLSGFEPAVPTLIVVVVCFSLSPVLACSSTKDGLGRGFGVVIGILREESSIAEEDEVV